MSTNEDRLSRRVWILCAALFALFLADPIALRAAAMEPPDGWKTLQENWYTIEIADQPAGWAKTIISQKNENYRTYTRTEMRLRRSDAVVEISTRETFIEQTDGTPLRMERVESQAGSQITHEWRFREDGVEHTVRQHGRTTRRDLPKPEGVWLTPRAADRYFKERRDAGAREFTVRRLESGSGITPVIVTGRRLREDSLTINGRDRPVTVWQVEYESLPIASIMHVSTDSVPLKQEVDLATFRITMRHASREHIERLIVEQVVDDVPEMLLEAMVTPDRPIDRVRETRRAVYRVSASDGDLPMLPDTGAQHVRADAESDRAVIVTVEVDSRRAELLDDEARRRSLAPSAMIDFNDEKVRELAHVKNVDRIEPMTLAEHLQRRVHRHITSKTLETAFASASETARTRRGDCTEHAVLLAALLRANEIPARIATGLVYVEHFAGRDHVFGWHMWTQAYIDGQWWDFDAVLPHDRFHAGYILVSTSALSDDHRYAGLASYVQLLGNIEIEVIDFAHE